MDVPLTVTVLVMLLGMGTYHTTIADLCARDSYYALTEACGRPCVKDEECDVEYRCLCDHKCGLTCVNYGETRCYPPAFPQHGFVRLMTVRFPPFDALDQMGAQAIYGCIEDYVLVGASIRVCMGSGKWSGDEPVCHGPVSDGDWYGVCGPVPTLAHAQHHAENFTVGSVTHYVCDEGYYHLGQVTTVRCQVNGAWSAPTTACKRVLCGSLSAPLHGQIHGLDFRYGAEALHTCDKGYFLVGTARRTCQATGTWSGAPPQCQAVDCGRPTTIPNGHWLGSDFTYSHAVQFFCEEGFALVDGSEQSTCGSDGRWSGHQPRCKAVDCGDPGIPANSIRRMDRTGGTGYNTTVSYSCQEGYELFGSPTRTCTLEGVWDGEYPECHKSCEGWPPVVANADRELPERAVHLAPVTYICKKNYRMEGPDKVRCLNGVWQTRLPVCVTTACNVNQNSRCSNEFPYSHVHKVKVWPTVAISQVVVAQQGQDLQLDCINTLPSYYDPRWKKAGSPTIRHSQRPVGQTLWQRLFMTNLQAGDTGLYICETFDGSSNAIYVTVQVTCPILDVQEHVRLSGQDRRNGDVVSLSCDEGYSLTGPTSIACQYGVWSARPPTCSKETCESRRLQDPIDGYSTVQRQPEPDTFIQTFYCDVGYELHGSERVTCANGNWYGSVPVCLPRLDKMTMRTDLSISRRTVRVREGTENVTVECRMTQEPVVSNTSGGPFNINGMEIPNSIQYPLGDGRHAWQVEIREVSAADHSGKLQCQDSAGKTEYIKLDIVASCPGRFRTPEHGYCQANPDCGMLYEGDTAEFDCYPGYVLVGRTVHTCTADGWDTEAIQCVPELAFRLKHGLMPRAHGDVIEVYAGADLVLDCTLTSEGRHRVQELSWRWQSWNSQTSSSNHSTSMDFFDQYFIDDEKEKRLFLPSISKEHAGNYTCQVGGPDSQGVAVVVQVLNSCSRLLPPENGTLTSWSHTVGTQVSYSCHEQYTLVGDSTRECQSTGQWTGAAPYCQVYRCSELSAPLHGWMAPTSFLLGTNVSFWCENGYNLSSEKDLVCTGDGSWSRKVPECISYCENYVCGKGEKCILFDGTPSCVCKTPADCSVMPGPVCGSDAETYGNECQLEVTSCSLGQDIRVVHTGFCKKAGMCYDVPVAVPDDGLTRCTHQYYMDDDRAGCELVPAGTCMTGPQGFDSKEHCDAACNASVVCGMPPAVTGNCSLSLTRWTYHPHSEECLPFVYTGCGGNENNFLSRDHCLQSCPVRCERCETVMQLNTACRFSTLLGSHALKTKVLEVATDESSVTLSVEESLHLPISELPAGNLTVPVMSSHGDCGCHPPRLLPLDSSYLIIFTYQLLVVDETTYVEVWDSGVEQQLNSLSNCAVMQSYPGQE
ncbi:CSMD1 [Branchiostoma lanceolatum]|uniref:CSMD1 protein n=2 Tax=Branchiostoma lanceolatum TaxID=7740 RepID=A0A8K0AAR1_BRALA|nr:CSMD1 [Branchiostoma lanceolatum]